MATQTPATAPVEQTETVKVKNIQVSASVSPELHAALQDIRWTIRAEKLSTVVLIAVQEFVERNRAKLDEAATGK